MARKKVGFGETLSYGIPRFRAEEKRVHFISILTPSVDVFTYHYADGFGSFHCFEGDCCKDFGPPTLRYVVPVIEYTILDAANFKYGGPVTLYYLPLSSDKYQTLITKIKLKSAEDPSLFDYSVTCSDAKYQKIEIDVVGEALWRKDENINKLIPSFLETYDAKIGFSVAREIDPTRYRTLVLGDDGGGVINANINVSTDAPIGIPASTTETPAIEAQVVSEEELDKLFE